MAQILGQTVTRPCCHEIACWRQLDHAPETIDGQCVDHLVKSCGFTAYYETSAITGRGVGELCEAVAATIDWESLGKTSRPELFQRIRDEIETRRKRGEVVLPLKDLQRAIVERDRDLQEMIKSLVSTLASQRKVDIREETLVILNEISVPEGLSVKTTEQLDYIQRACEELQLRWLAEEVRLSFVELSQAVITKDVAAVTRAARNPRRHRPLAESPPANRCWCFKCRRLSDTLVRSSRGPEQSAWCSSAGVASHRPGRLFPSWYRRQRTVAAQSGKTSSRMHRATHAGTRHLFQHEGC